MIVVSNTSPIINLAKLDSLHLLQKLYKNIQIPEAVYYEITNYDQAGSKEVKKDDWVIKRSVSNHQFVSLLEQELDKGESEAITLSLELKSSLLLIDEQLGRMKAKSLGLKYTGLLGVLLQAKANKLIPSVKPFMDDLINIAGFYLSDTVYHDTLILANEK